MPTQIENYVQVKRQVVRYRQQFQDLGDVPPAKGFVLQNGRSDLSSKHTTLLLLEFEATLRVRDKNITPESRSQENWLLRIISLAQSLNAPAKTYALLADLTLSASIARAEGESQIGRSLPLISVKVAATLLRNIIGAARTTAEYDIDQASRWVRCVVQVILDGIGHQNRQNDEESEILVMLEEVVDQALVMAGNLQQHQAESRVDLDRNSRTGNSFAETTGGHPTGVAAAVTVSPYPTEELEWLSTTLFNLAVDLYVAEKEPLAKNWAGKAVEVADMLSAGGDGGLLVRVLRSKIADLGLE